MRRPILALLAVLALAACGDGPIAVLPPEPPLLSNGQNGTGILVSGLTLGLCQQNGQLTASGTITVTNEGDVDTEGLTLAPRVQYKTRSGPFQDLPGASQIIVPAGQIPAGASETYPYSITFAPVPDARYRLAALVTITNHSGSLGVPRGPEPKADFPAGSPPPCTGAVNTAPVVSITAPAAGAVFTQGTLVTFTGSATDNEQGDLSASLVWSSSINGSLGTGASVSTSALSVGTHTITASVTDAGGMTSQASISMRINAPPTVSITAPADGSSFTAGTSITFTGTASDPENGNLSASIGWSSSLDGSFGTGASVSTSALSVGTHTITASVTDSDGASGSASISITINAAAACSTPTPAGYTRTWTGGTSTDWATAGNWSPSGVPASSDNVFICAGTPNAPTLAADATINDLLVQSGATLTVASGATLTATGHVNAGSTITGAGVVRMTGVGKTVQGTLFNLLIQALGTITLAGNTTLTGNLSITRPIGTLTDPDLDLNGRTLHVQGNFTGNHGTFTMNQATTVFDIDGSVDLLGANSSGKLTAGTMRVGGDFRTGLSTGICSGNELLTSGTHLVILDGTAAQSVDLVCSNATQQRFNLLRITNTAGVTFVKNAYVGDDVDLIGQMTVPSGITLTIVDTLFLRSTSVLNNSGTINEGSCVKESGATINGTDPCT